MDKKRVLSIYTDFSNGKLFTAEERINLPDKLKRFDKFLLNNKINFNITSYDNKATKHRSLTPEHLKKPLHPVFVRQLTQGLVQLRNKEYKETGDKQYAIFLSDCAVALEQLQYQQAYKTYKASNDNVYIVTSEVFDYFASVELPDDLTLGEVRFTRDTPSLFIFEREMTIGYLSYFFMPDVTQPELFVEIFGHNQKPYRSHDIVLHSSSWVFDNKSLVKQNMEAVVGLTENEKKYSRFFYNILLFLASKDTIAYQSEELNQQILTAQNNIRNGTNVNRNEKLLAELPSYKFVDLAVTIDSYTRDYYRQNPLKEDSRTVTPHWRSGHYQSYWYGKKDGSEVRRKERLFIPTVWVGNPELVKDQTIFKTLKRG